MTSSRDAAVRALEREREHALGMLRIEVEGLRARNATLWKALCSVSVCWTLHVLVTLGYALWHAP